MDAPEAPRDAAGDDLDEADRLEVERGLRFTHIMMTMNKSQGNEAIASIQALAALLVRKGMIDPDEFGEELAVARDAIGRVVQPTVRLAAMGDKYAEGESVDIDCASRIPLCGARCCSFAFFLTEQDVAEGVARWDYGNPYWIKRADDGFCVHCEPETRACGIHASRPHVCRKYDCRNDPRVWIDFEARIPAPMPPPGRTMPIAMAEADASAGSIARGERERASGHQQAP